MIEAATTEKGVGVTIRGDYWDLRSLHETIHALVHSAPIKERHKEYLLGFAYEVRRAFWGEREKIRGSFQPENIYFGTKLTWPEILFDVAILRPLYGLL